MVKLKVKNFGPIKEGYRENDGYMIIPDITLFIGDQGTGKSSIAKILSTCSWIEKTILKDSNVYRQESDGIKEFKYTDAPVSAYYLKHSLEYQNIQNYFSEDTFIEYIGDYYKIIYSGGETSFYSLHCEKEEVSYILPQIMYVPAERNFISVVEGAKSVKNLPSPLYTFLDEYEDAVSALGGQKQKLPLSSFEYQFDNSIKEGVILGTDSNYKIKLSEASSGLQSATPLFLVTDYLSKLITGKYNTLSKKRLSLTDDMSKDEMINLVREAKADDWQEKMEIQNIEDRFKNKRFLNIVEEMEQNLYPKSQQGILYDLIRCVNSTEGNSLILTTHSPYVINYLSLAIKAYAIKTKIKPNSNNKILSDLNIIVPQESTISGDRVVIYELGQDGRITKLPT
jgi:predicted ATPase